MIRIKSIVLFLTVLTLLILENAVFSQSRDDDTVVTYPGGDYGINTGAGYGIMPDGQLMTPASYREDYKNTKYGPMTGRGFLVFPNFSFPSERSRPDPREESEKKEKQIRDFIFYQSTTSTEGSPYQGVSD